MQNYPYMQNYSNYPMPTHYQDRLSQLQSNYQQTIGTPTPINQGLLWVSGEVGAKSYLVAPNSTVLLMDSDAQRFYLKSADGAGMPSMRIFEYKEVVNNTQNVVKGADLDENILSDKFVTREEYEGLKSQYKSIMERLDNMVSNVESLESSAKSKPRTRGGNGTNEQSDI